MCSVAVNMDVQVFLCCITSLGRIYHILIKYLSLFVMGTFLLPKNWTQDSLETTGVSLRCYHHPSIYTICLRVERIHDNQKLSTCWTEIEREWNESISSKNY